MSIAYIRARTTQDNVEFERHSQSDASLLLTSIGGSTEFEVTLTVGDVYSDGHPANAGEFSKLKNDQISIPPCSSITLEVAEDISVPLNLFGIIFPKGSLSHVNGVFSPTTKIDPGYSGRLRLLVFNGSRKRIVLNKGQAVASAVFLRTDTTVRHPLVERRDKINPVSQGIFDTIVENFRGSARPLSVVVPVIAVIISCVSLWVSYLSSQAATRSAIASEAIVKSRTMQPEAPVK